MKKNKLIISIFLFLLSSNYLVAQEQKEEFLSVGFHEALTFYKNINANNATAFDQNLANSSNDIFIFWQHITDNKRINNIEIGFLNRKYNFMLDSSLIQANDNLLSLSYMRGRRFTVNDTKLSFDCNVGLDFKTSLERKYFNSPNTPIYTKQLPDITSSKLFYLSLVVQFKVNYHFGTDSYITLGQNLNLDLAKFGGDIKNYSQKFLSNSFFFGLGFNFN